MKTEVQKGQEFREDTRRAKSLPPEIIKRLTRINPLKSTLGLLQTVAILAACIGLSIYYWTPWVVIPCLFIIATRQQACFVLAHDAAHYRMYKTRWLNDLAGRLIASPVGISMCSYRVVHRLHHNHLYGKQDPDIPLHGGYPRGKAYLFKKLLKDLTGSTAFKTFSYFFGAPAPNKDQANTAYEKNRPLDDTSPALRKAADLDRWGVLAFHIIMPTICWYMGYLLEYLVLWILPLLTLLQPILRFRAICEHGAVRSLDEPMKASRTNTGPAWIRFLLFPHSVNYHIEHHLYPSIPHYNLAECHRELLERGLLDNAEVRDIRETAKMIIAPKAA
ncbi:MAG: fatty acid desaturase family protein [Sneathiellales bacterium]|nr:fatty acid desaturase family protein [Sneathiellales bacterium]